MIPIDKSNPHKAQALEMLNAWIEKGVQRQVHFR
jgi:hypothetical protein